MPGRGEVRRIQALVVIETLGTVHITLRQTPLAYCHWCPRARRSARYGYDAVRVDATSTANVAAAVGGVWSAIVTRQVGSVRGLSARPGNDCRTIVGPL